MASKSNRDVPLFVLIAHFDGEEKLTLNEWTRVIPPKLLRQTLAGCFEESFSALRNSALAGRRAADFGTVARHRKSGDPVQAGDQTWGILLALASFIAFALVDRLVASIARLIVGPLVSVVLLGRDLLTPGRTPKILEVGTTPLFGAWRSTLC